MGRCNPEIEMYYLGAHYFLLPVWSIALILIWGQMYFHLTSSVRFYLIHAKYVNFKYVHMALSQNAEPLYFLCPEIGFIQNRLGSPHCNKTLF